MKAPLSPALAAGKSPWSLRLLLAAALTLAGLLPAQAANAPAPYSVSDILGAYNATGLGLTGSGQTIAILTETGPNLSDLSNFWAANGIQQSIANIETVNVDGLPLPSPQGDETIAAEWSSSIAPGAKVRVYATGTLGFTGIIKGLQKIIDDLPDHPEIHQLSISIGLGETYLLSESQILTASQCFATLAKAGVSVFVASGDHGSNPDDQGGTKGPLQVEYFASDPNVTGVGGTALKLHAATRSVISEKGWAGSGGGVSQYFTRPLWQAGKGVPEGAMRVTPDVSLVADPSTSAALFLSGSAQKCAGTSLGAPVWAAFCALLNEARAKASLPPIGLLNPSLYPLLRTASFRDISGGSNGKYTAKAGYDNVTGLGTPNVATLIQTLSATNAPPLLSSFTPASGAIGATVTLNGLHLSRATGVQLSGTDVSFKVISDTQLTATVPWEAKSGLFSVTTPGGTVKNAGKFTVATGFFTSTIFSTAFETAEGYDLSADLAGQMGWLQSLSGGNGLIEGCFPDEGNQAYLGFTPPTATDTAAFIFRPINYVPAPGEVITFSTRMAVIDSTTDNGNYDLFHWSIYNTNSDRLFSLEFDNDALCVYYVLENETSATVPGISLVPGQIYNLLVTIDFPRNKWSATLNGKTVAANKPVTTQGSALNLGDIDAGWLLTSSTAGDNYMAFDNYSVKKASPLFSVTARPSPPKGGTTSGGNTYVSGTSCTVTATPASGYRFVNWTEGGKSLTTGTSYSFVATSHRALIANFQQITYKITLSATPSSGGAASGAGIYASGATATAVAIPQKGYRFVSWTEGSTPVSTSAKYLFSASAGRTLVAHFEAVP